MKKYIVLAAMAAFALVSCNGNKIETDDPDNGGGTATVTGVVLNEVDGINKVIELYNTSDKEMSLEGVTIVKYDAAKEGGKSTTWTGAAGLKIAAKAWLYLESSDLSDEIEGGDPDYKYQDNLGTYVFKGGLSGKKNVKLELVAPDGKVLDTFTRGEEGAGWNQVSGFANNKTNSFCRVPDGTGEWVYAAPTKGAKNGEKTGEIEQTNA